MFKKFLKKRVIPIAIVALLLAVGVSLFFSVSNSYKKKSIVSTYKMKEENKTTTFKSDGEQCLNRFRLMGFSVDTVENSSNNSKIKFKISSKSTASEYKQLLDESGYSKSVSYQYRVQEYKTVKGEKKWVTIEEPKGTKLEGTITISNKKYTSTVESPSDAVLPIKNRKYRVIISNTKWIRDKECTKGDHDKNSSPDDGYCTCDPGNVKLIYEFTYSSISGDAEFQLTQTDYTIEGIDDDKPETGVPAGQGPDQNVNNYNVSDNCKLPNNTQANKYLLPDTNVYVGEKKNSRTFRQYLAAFDAQSDKSDKTIEVEGNEVKGASISLTCDYKLDINDIKDVASNDVVAYNSKGLKYYKYDASNTKYYKASKTQKIKVKDYVWHTTYGKTTDNKNNYCTRKCTEVVKVEYGAPVYVEAGMCFQYRMKISSIVQCEYDTTHLKPPSKKYKICQPTAYCKHGSSTSSGSGGNTQAGPNEDYEACINQCDGGKYTQECSNACYNIVYGNQKYNDLVLSYDTKPTRTSTSAQGFTTYFRYNGSFHFDHSGGDVSCGSTIGQSGNNPRATGFSMKGYRIKCLSGIGTYRMLQGIPYAINSDGSLCSDPCGWIGGPGCGGSAHDWYFEGDTYHGKYGEHVFKKDYADNHKLYEDALNECKAKATCVKSTTTYTIKVRYVDATDKELKISEASYPFSSATKETKSPGTNCSSHKMTGGSPLISFGGCYVNNDADRWYQGEITFPGVYLDYKHNTFVIGKKKNDSDILMPGRMCINNVQGNTNAVWAKKFDEAIGKLNDNSSYTISNLDNYWKNSFSETKYGKDGVEGYNIKGIITDFGYFKWDFNISCFYALYVPCKDDKITCSKDCGEPSESSACYTADQAKGQPECKQATCNTRDDYNVRSYNASDPLVMTESRENDEVQYKEDVLTGYNWTSAATLTEMKNGYNNNPEYLVDNIIKYQNNVFDNNSNKPNYVVFLDIKTIKNIKKYNGKSGYYTFNDENPLNANRVNEEAGVKFYYSSEFLHNKSIFVSKFNQIPGISSDIYKCNYFVNGSCKYLVGGGE